MEDVIAIKVKGGHKRIAAFMTWGRVFDKVDTLPIQRAIANAAAQFGIREIKSIIVCESLQEVAHFPYFYEVLLMISWKPIPFGKKYKAWATKTRRQILEGKEVYFLGFLNK